MRRGWMQGVVERVEWPASLVTGARVLVDQGLGERRVVTAPRELGEQLERMRGLRVKIHGFFHDRGLRMERMEATSAERVEEVTCAR